jgi:hypothetical protein
MKGNAMGCKMTAAGLPASPFPNFDCQLRICSRRCTTDATYSEGGFPGGWFIFLRPCHGCQHTLGPRSRRAACFELRLRGLGMRVCAPKDASVEKIQARSGQRTQAFTDSIGVIPEGPRQRCSKHRVSLMALES